MSNYIFTKEERNEFKVAMAVIRHNETSWVLRRMKIQEICYMLGYGEDVDVEIFDAWVESIEALLNDDDWRGVREYIFLELLYLEAYSEIVDFGLDGFKVKVK